jgi:Zn-finger nucleic acid-binding protein
MKCPKCNEVMEKVVFESVEVDRCTGCCGLWFDALEAEDLKQLAGSERIDVGDRQTGRVFNEERQIDCPKCAVPMIRMVVAEQPHIRYECCKLCGGLFFDAGEFKDFKTKTLADFIKDLFAKPDR